MRIFGRNSGRPYADEYEDEIERVLTAVGNPDFVTLREGLERVAEIDRVLGPVSFISDQALCDEEDAASVVREDHFAPFDSIFQETAWQDDYSDIMTELCRINTQEAFA